MSAACVAAGKEPSVVNPPGAPVPAPTAVEFHYTQSDSFVALLKQLAASLPVSTYQANKRLVVREAGGGLSTLVRTFEKPMGLAVDARRLGQAGRRLVVADGSLVRMVEGSFSRNTENNCPHCPHCPHFDRNCLYILDLRRFMDFPQLSATVRNCPQLSAFR